MPLSLLLGALTVTLARAGSGAGAGDDGGDGVGKASELALSLLVLEGVFLSRPPAPRSFGITCLCFL